MLVTNLLEKPCRFIDKNRQEHAGEIVAVRVVGPDYRLVFTVLHEEGGVGKMSDVEMKSMILPLIE